MYAYEWDPETGGLLLKSNPADFSKEPRPVYYQELDILGFDKYWNYTKDDSFPYMWAEANNYFYRGRKVALTKGGSFCHAPEIQLIDDPEPDGAPLRFVDIPQMVEKNHVILDSLVQETIKQVYNTYKKYQNKVDVFYVAFSGGKDSIVTLDIVQKALPHNAFKVLFGDTGMEFPDTYDVVEKTKMLCDNKRIDFLTSKSQFPTEFTWKHIGPPSSTMRWCCSVHKTSPQIIKLRNILQKSNFTGMAFIGVRASESLARSEYDYISLGEKHKGQYSCNPILDWNSAELYLYIYQNHLLINETYKKGNRRAGCLLCPKASERNEYMTDIMYPNEVSFYKDLIFSSYRNTFDNEENLNNFISKGGWKARKNGRDITAISNYNESVENNILYITIDGHDGLSGQVLSVLDRIKLPGVNQLDKNETRVFKTILLLQALGINVGESVEVFAPNKQNIGNVFEGSSLQPTKAVLIADKLVRDHLVMEKSVGNNQFVYNVPIGDADGDKIRKIKDELAKDTTTARILETANGYIANTLSLSGVLEKRYFKRHAGITNFSSALTQLRGQAAHSAGNTILLLSIYARDDNESALLKGYIDNAFENGTSQIVFLDASLSPMGSDLFDQYIEARANEEYYTKIDAANAANYRKKAEDVLKKWRERIENGEFMLYTPENRHGERLTTLSAVYDALKTYDIASFPESPESMGNVIDTMWLCDNNLSIGITCGIENETKGTYKSNNNNTKLENLIGEAWKLNHYWEVKPYLPISKIKIEVEKLIKRGFDENGRFAVRDVYRLLEAKPYGMFACNLTGFLMGFLLSEYADASYNWYDGVTNEVMSKEKLKKTIEKVIKNALTASEKGRVEYILTMTEEERAFHTLSSEAFNIPKERCSAIGETRRLVRKEMEGLYFPLWCVTYKLPAGTCRTNMSVIDEVINAYSGLVNPGNIAGDKTEADLAKQIGTLRMKNPDLSDDLKRIITKNRCQEGMDSYLHDYRGGLLPLIAGQINDGGKYIHCIRDKFDAQAANWVWHKDTVNQKIDEVIRDYQIIQESNEVLPKSTTFEGMLSEWQEKIKYFRVSFKAVRNSMGAMEPFCEMLYELKKTGTLPESKRDEFLKELRDSKDEFRAFAMDQLPVFRSACDYYLFDMNEDDCAQVYQTLPINCFTQEKSDYLKNVESAVKDYRRNQTAVKLRQFWYEKTLTNSPEEWSEKYGMPILCMIDSKDYDRAKKAFDTLNNKKPDNDAMAKAQEFLETATIFDKLKDETLRDKAFREKILKGREILLENLDEVKRNIKMREPYIPPYNWLGHPNIDRCLAQMCDAKYQEVGYDKAIETINSMDPDEVKRYLKDLLKDNVTVGMEIIRSKRH